MSFELPKPDAFCHHTGFEKKCLSLVTSGKCKRWGNLPGSDPFTGLERPQWGCVDDLVLFLQGEASRQAEAAHTSVTEFREMVINPEYLDRHIANTTPMKTIEDTSNANHDHRS